MSFHGEFLKRNLSSITGSGVATSNFVSIAQWSEPRSVECIAHFTTDDVILLALHVPLDGERREPWLLQSSPILKCP
jgi:hypothetical protein